MFHRPRMELLVKLTIFDGGSDSADNWQKRGLTLIRPPSVNRQNGARTTLTRFFCLNRCCSFPVPTRISHNRHQDRKRSCTKHLSRFTPLLVKLGSGCADIIRATWKLYRTLMPSHSKKRARVCARRSWYRARRGAEHTETDTSRFNYLRSGTGLQSRNTVPGVSA